MPFRNSDRTQPENAPISVLGECPGAQRSSAGKPVYHQSNCQGTRQKQQYTDGTRICCRRRNRQRGQDEVKRQNLADYLQHGESIVGRALIKMRTMGGPERLAPDYPAQQRHRGVGKVIKRQQQRGNHVLPKSKLKKAPAEQQANRQAPDISEKDLCYWTIEGGESNHRPAERRGNNGC